MVDVPRTHGARELLPRHVWHAVPARNHRGSGAQNFVGGCRLLLRVEKVKPGDTRGNPQPPQPVVVRCGGVRLCIFFRFTAFAEHGDIVWQLRFHHGLQQDELGEEMRPLVHFPGFDLSELPEDLAETVRRAVWISDLAT